MATATKNTIQRNDLLPVIALFFKYDKHISEFEYGLTVFLKQIPIYLSYPCKDNTFFDESSRISTHFYLAHQLSSSFAKASGRLSPFKPCGRCCHELLITATATPLLPPFGDSGRQGREVVTFVEGQPHHTPRGPGTLPFPFGERHRAHPHTTGRAYLLCLSLNRIRAVSRFTAVVRESPLPLC